MEVVLLPHHAMSYTLRYLDGSCTLRRNTPVPCVNKLQEQ